MNSYALQKGDTVGHLKLSLRPRGDHCYSLLTCPNKLFTSTHTYFQILKLTLCM